MVGQKRCVLCDTLTKDSVLTKKQLLLAHSDVLLTLLLLYCAHTFSEFFYCCDLKCMMVHCVHWYTNGRKL